MIKFRIIQNGSNSFYIQKRVGFIFKRWVDVKDYNLIHDWARKLFTTKEEAEDYIKFNFMRHVVAEL